jgi:hypothetical protein
MGTLHPAFFALGKPSNQQPEIFRSLILMSHFKYGNIAINSADMIAIKHHN